MPTDHAHPDECLPLAGDVAAHSVAVDYATLVDAVVRRHPDCPASMPFDDTGAMARFSRSFLFRNARGRIVVALAHDAALRAAVGTRYPGFVTPDAGADDLFALRDPLTMAIFARFVMRHATGCPDPRMLCAIQRAIAEETAAMLAAPAHSERGNGMMRVDRDSATFVSRAGLVAGLAWLHDHVAGRGGAAVH